MSAQMTQLYQATLAARDQIHGLIEAARSKGVTLVDGTGLLPQELTVLQVSQLIDEYFGIDRGQLDAERQAALEAAGECPCERSGA